MIGRSTEEQDCFSSLVEGTSSHTGCPILSGQPWTHVHSSNAKRTQKVTDTHVYTHNITLKRP